MSEKKLLSDIIDEAVKEANFLLPVPFVKDIIRNMYKFFLIM